jgi:hypothetical protein
VLRELNRSLSKLYASEGRPSIPPEQLLSALLLQCRLYRKAVGREAKLSYMGHVTMENRHGLAVAGMVTLANGTAERRAAEAMLKAKAKEVGHRITVGEDKAYDTADHVANLRAINVTPHVTQNASLTSTGKRRQSAIDARTTRHEG